MMASEITNDLEIAIQFGPRKGEILRGRRAHRYLNDPHYRNHYDGGMTPRMPQATAPQPAMASGKSASPPPTEGPGVELKALLSSLGVDPGGCDCNTRAAQMDVWGIEGCRAYRAEIVAWLHQAQSRLKWSDKLTIGFMSVVTGNAWAINPTDPIGSLVDEAIRRAEAKTKPSGVV